MKKIILILPLFLGLMLISCGDAESDTDSDADSTDTEIKGDDTQNPVVAEIEVSDEMAAFIGAFNGDYKNVEAGLAEYGANDDIVDHDMGGYQLDEPKVNSKDGECYNITCKSGMVENTYDICWEGGKIVSITGG